MFFPEKKQVECLVGSAEGKRGHSRMLRNVSGHNGRIECVQENLFHTIDICPESEIGIVGERLGDIRIGARYISVFLIHYQWQVI